MSVIRMLQYALLLGAFCTTFARISPILERVDDNCDGTYTAHFGYYNRDDFERLIPHGNQNKITPGSNPDKGQPTRFLPGRHYDVFTVPFGGDRKLVWTLDGRTSTAGGGAAANSCESKSAPDYADDAVMVTAEDIHVFTKDAAPDDPSEMKLRLYIQNVGTHTAKDFRIYYFLKTPPGKTPVLELYRYPLCRVYLEDLNDGEYALVFEFPGVTLEPSQTLPDLNGYSIGIHYSDWSDIDKSTFFSYTPNTVFAETNRVPFLAKRSVVTGVSPTYKLGDTVTVVVNRLKCNETEDWTGADECRLQVIVDGTLLKTFSKDLNDGDHYDINEEFDFNETVEFRLIDVDAGWGDDDDDLGSVVVTKTSASGTRSMNTDGAKYDLSYTIKSRPITTPILNSGKRRLISVETLKCHETEDFTGDDECQFKIVVDGRLVADLTRDMNNGDVWTIGAEYVVDNAASLVLWDDDTDVWDSPDHLGTVLVDTTLGSYEGKFTKDGANYTVTYEVSEKNHIVSDLETYVLNKFRNSTATGMWPNLSKGTIISQIENTINSPWLIDQGQYGFCGPASIGYALASRYPARYVSMCRDIFEKASFQARSRKYQVDGDEDVLDTKHDGSLRDVDWMFCAFLRDEANGVFDIDSHNWTFEYITTSMEMAEWTKDILGYTNTGWETNFLYGEKESIKRAARCADAWGGFAFFLVDAGEMSDRADNWFGFNHWIAYEPNSLQFLDGDSYTTHFHYFTWAEIIDGVGSESLHHEFNESSFEDLYHGAVWGY